MVREVVVVSGVRTPIGGYGGSLQDIPPSNLAAQCVKEAVSRAQIEPDEVGHVVFGNVIHTDARSLSGSCRGHQWWFADRDSCSDVESSLR